MKRLKPKLPGDYNNRSSSPKGICITDRFDESASLRVTKSRKKKKKVSNSDPHLPIDLIMEILKRLPVKTLARFLCVSKHLGSIIRSPDFVKLFLNEKESSNGPDRLFFHFRTLGKADYIFSSNPGEDSVATHHLTFPRLENTNNPPSCVHDLICYRTAASELVVYNSTTKRSFTLPKLEPLVTEGSFFRHLLGYEPIDAVYKVLCARMTKQRPVFRVLTLGSGNEWRMIENTGHHHIPFSTQICTDGVIYYDAYAHCGSQGITGEVPVVMSFDLRSEKFNLIKGPASADFNLQGVSALSKYDGKLAFISSGISADGCMVLWVLQDAIKHQWLKKIFVLPNSWMSLAQSTRLPLPPHELHSVLNITVSGEFILAPFSPCVAPFYVLYYDPKINSLRKVSIQGIMEHELLSQRNGEKLCYLYNISFSQVESLTFW